MANDEFGAKHVHDCEVVLGIKIVLRDAFGVGLE